MFLDVMVFHDFLLVFMIIQGIFMILMAFYGFSWFLWPTKVFSWCFMVWFILLNLQSSMMRVFRTNVFAMFLGFILMVANYRSSDAMNAMYRSSLSESVTRRRYVFSNPLPSHFFEWRGADLLLVQQKLSTLGSAVTLAIIVVVSMSGTFWCNFHKLNMCCVACRFLSALNTIMSAENTFPIKTDSILV